MANVSSLDGLVKEFTGYKVCLDNTAKLFDETNGLYCEMQEKFAFPQDKLPLTSLESVPSAGQMPSVMFIGNQNCGKSTLLNVLLKKKHLPTHENPCTSRIVRAVYSAKGNYARLVDDKGTIIEEKRDFKGKVPEKLVVLEDADKDDLSNLRAIVEVGLKHEFLESGIELIDSPGRCESDALDRVVEGFLQRDVVPLIVYVIDGNHHIQQKDRSTIRELQDKFPNISMMFVCSKVDILKEADKYDCDDEDGVQKTEEETTEEERNVKAQEKKKIVFQQLKQLGFLKEDADIDSTSDFHGISARRVRKARAKEITNDATASFDRLQFCILERLCESLRRQCQKALSTLLSSNEMVLSITASRRKAMAFTKDVLPAVCKQALDTEMSLYNAELELFLHSNEITKTIHTEMVSLTSEFLKQAEEYQSMDQKTLKREFDSVKIEAKLHPLQSCQIKLEELLVMNFVGDMKGNILDKTFNVMKGSLNRALRDSISTAVGEMIKLSQSVNHPFLLRLFQRIYEMDLEQLERNTLDGQASLEKLHEILDGLFETVNAVVSTTLRREISRPLSKFDVKEVGRSQRPRDPFWRRKVVQTLISKLDYEKISKSIIEACANSLFNIHKHFQLAVKAFRDLNEALINAPAQFENVRIAFVPLVAEVAVKAHALQYLISKGPVELGEFVTHTAHSQVYTCCSTTWGGPDERVVKVVDRPQVGDEVWKQTMMDTMHTKDIFDKLGTCPANHLRLIGWVMPTPSQMHIVMDRIKYDLLTFLQTGPLWDDRLKVANDVAEGLLKIHEAEYVYQDLKPQNVVLSAGGVAKINLCKPEKPLENTKLGWPFHISPTMYQQYRQGLSSESFDVYSFGSLLWVLCEGSGRRSPRAFEHCTDNEAMKEAVLGGVRPERPDHASDACWELMTKCWSESITIKDVIKKLTNM